MIPFKDNIPTLRLPIVTLVLIALNVIAFIWQLSYPTDPKLEKAGFGAIDQSALEMGAIPYRIMHPGENPQCAVGAVNDAGAAGVVCSGTSEYRQAVKRGETSPGLVPIPIDQIAWWLTLITSMFLHGGILHIAGNMLFLWVFGNNIEDSMGRFKFVIFYLLAGLVAVYSQALVAPESTAPTIGASGAVAGVLGGYALLFPKARVLSLVILVFFFTVIEVPALVMLGLWFVLQFVPALGQIAVDTGGQDGVAYMAHVGGFIFGLAAIRLFVRKRPPAAMVAGWGAS